MLNPIATYRIQLHADFSLTTLERILPYLKQLGVGTIYASPITEATPGSQHGYDGVNPLRISPDLGTLADLTRISEQLRTAGMYWLQDIVPNHMAFHTQNEWLIDVLEKGPLSLYAAFFDTPFASDLFIGPLMAPFLPDEPESLIRQGALSLIYEDQRLYLTTGDSRYPLSPRSYALVLRHSTPGESTPGLAIGQLLAELDQLHAVDEPEAYALAWDEWRDQLAGLDKTPQAHEYLKSRLDTINRQPDRLLALLGEQHYELCPATLTDRRINYRRFFTVNDLICLRMHNPQVFAEYHQLFGDLVRQGVFQGVRVDHVDGLFDPTTYLDRLRALVGTDTYLVVEKILTNDETLPANWPVAGTTGYDFLASVNNLLTWPDSRPVLDAFYAGLTGIAPGKASQRTSRKAFIAYQHLLGELENLTHFYQTLALSPADALQALPDGALLQTLAEWLIRCPVYRYFGNALPLPTRDATALRTLFDAIRQERPELGAAVDLLTDAFLTHPTATTTGHNERAIEFYQRCMQYAGPLMAKGVEDTLFYTNTAFLAHNEVGDAPERFGLSVADFHQQMHHRRNHWPLTQNATATHDTKRGEDVRARLNVLSELAPEWIDAVTRWQALNTPESGTTLPDPSDQYLLFQTLVGAYPMPGQPDTDWKERLHAYLDKVIDEAKRHTDDGYREAIHAFATFLLDKRRAFWTDFQAFHQKIADFGIVNALVQLVLKSTVPGIPDYYQGSEGWDLKLVDPDNRRPVPYDSHMTTLDALLTNPPEPADLWADRSSGRIKLWLTHALLQLRQQYPELFVYGRYVPLAVRGRYGANLLAFLRDDDTTRIAVVVPLHTARLCVDQGVATVGELDWADTAVLMPHDLPRDYTDWLTGASGQTTNCLLPKTIFRDLPVAVLRLV